MKSEAIKVDIAVTPRLREITAYASIFGNRDNQGQIVHSGAFAKSIKEKLGEKQIKLFRNHDEHIGVVTHAEEDSKGLLTVAYVSKTECGDETLEQVQDGSLSRYSFRGWIMKADWSLDGEDPATGDPIETFNLREINLREVGPVNLDPANDEAVILSVKGLADDDVMERLAELPALLRGYTARKSFTHDDRAIARQLLRITERAAGCVDGLKALLAPEHATPAAPRKEPVAATPAAAAPELGSILAEVAKNRAWARDMLAELRQL